jgi:large subunit ribosomal protein L23
LGVNVITVQGSTRKIGRRRIVTSPWKKAVVTVKAGQKIEFFEGV